MLASGMALLSGSVSANNETDDVATLRQQWNLFLSFSPSKQQRIRELDQQLHALPEGKEKQYRKVMENYLAWLDHLPETDRKKLNEPGMQLEEKLYQIRQIRLREWIESLPESYRKKWDEVKADPNERSKLLEAWKEEQEIRADEWQVAQRHLGENGQMNLAKLFEHPDVKESLEAYLRNLARHIPPAERVLLEVARQNVINGSYFEAGRTIYLISERNPLLPGPENAPKSFDTLPANVKALLPDPKDKPNKLFREATQRHLNRWPDYAKAVNRYMTEHKLKLPQPLGPCKLSEMPEGVKLFVEKKLTPELLKTPKGEKELKQLLALEGTWPDYPERIMELAKNYKLTIPGWSLPAQELWNANFKVLKRTKL
jgi:hypothetical protein